LSERLDDLVMCSKCHTLHKRVKLPHNKVAKCTQCGTMLYSNVADTMNKAIAFAITALTLFIIANLFPILNVSIAGVQTDLIIPEMIYRMFENGFIVIGSILFIVVLLAPLTVLLSFITLGLLSYLKIYKFLARKIILFLIISRQWAMVDIFTISILVALVKLFGYAQIHFGVAFYALLLFVVVDLFFLKTIRPTELWIYFDRKYSDGSHT
jgi:paraquat-inducible protein A